MINIPKEIINYIFTFIQSDTNKLIKEYFKNNKLKLNNNIMIYRRHLINNKRPIDILYDIRYFKHFQNNNIQNYLSHIKNVSLYKINFS
jgi:hypothetical protein